MKIISALLIALVTLPIICFGLASSTDVDFKDIISSDHASVYLVTNNLNSEPAIMILIGTGLIGIAGIGRRITLKKDNVHKDKKRLSPTLPPLPDPVPWKKEN